MYRNGQVHLGMPYLRSLHQNGYGHPSAPIYLLSSCMFFKSSAQVQNLITALYKLEGE